MSLVAIRRRRSRPALYLSLSSRAAKRVSLCLYTPSLHRRSAPRGRGRSLVKIRLCKALVFADAVTAKDYARSYASFAAAESRRDAHCEVRQELCFDGYDEDERLLANIRHDTPRGGVFFGQSLATLARPQISHTFLK